MCLTTAQKHPSIVSRDRICYKIMYYEKRKFLWFKWNSIRSAAVGFRYTLNKLYKTDFGVKDYKEFKIINQGFHSYRSYNQAIRIYQEYYSNIPEAHIFRCIIPKGSKCYSGRDGCLASNQIIIKEIL